MVLSTTNGYKDIYIKGKKTAEQRANPTTGRLMPSEEQEEHHTAV